jgi:hypothetical protein
VWYRLMIVSKDRRCVVQAYDRVQGQEVCGTGLCPCPVANFNFSGMNLPNELPETWLLGLDRECSEAERPKTFRY